MVNPVNRLCGSPVIRPQVAQSHYRNADVPLACEWCCVTNGYLQTLVWDTNGFS